MFGKIVSAVLVEMNTSSYLFHNGTQYSLHNSRELEIKYKSLTFPLQFTRLHPSESKIII
uniref:Uncharacterized protein n=1 Tax=Arundo donax TaxID=35708 RepID=A0A0A9PT89_ARUDO